MIKNKLDCVFIRDQDKDGKWGSFSLQELIDMGVAGREISIWFRKRIMSCIGLEPGEILTEKHVLRMLDVLEKIGAGVYYYADKEVANDKK